MGIIKTSDSLAMREALRAVLPRPARGGKYRIAFSGGMDSTVLLHALKDLPGISAVHVNHGMQTQADAWQQHVEAQCRQWAVPLECKQVRPNIRDGGPESAAREQRYAALAESMDIADILLTAQHADDQAETFLLQALRGAGIRGLSGMPQVAEFGPGRLARPLLQFTRKQIRDYALSEHLNWVEDPSNRDPNLGRGYLRQQITPLLDAQWPSHVRQLSRAAAWNAQAAELADDMACIDLADCAGPVDACLDIGKISGKSAARQSNLLRYWIHSLDLAPPDHRHLEQILKSMKGHATDGQFLVNWADVQVRGFCGWLFAMLELVDPPKDFHMDWTLQSALKLPESCGRLKVVGTPDGTSAEPVSVRFRQGGEKLLLNGRNHQHSLKQLLQESGVPGWVRARLPLVYQGDQLVAVADYWRKEHIPQLFWADAPPGAQLPRVVATNAFS